MAKSGLRHIDVGPELTKTEWESEDSHELIHGTSFPGSPVERQLFYKDDEHVWYIYDGSGWVSLQGTGGGGMEVHGNEYHDPDFASEAALAAHAAAATGIHGVGGSTVESVAGSQAKVDAHKDLATGVHGVGANYVAQAPAASHLVRTFTKGWTAGTNLLGAGVNVNPVEVPADVSAQAKRTSALSILTDTLTAVTWQAEDWDTDSIWSAGAPTRLTCKTIGKYMVWYLIIFADNVTGTRLAHVRKNGTSYPIQFSAGMDTFGRWRCSVSGVLSLVVNDYIEIVVFQSSGAALNIDALCIAGMIKLV